MSERASTGRPLRLLLVSSLVLALGLGAVTVATAKSAKEERETRKQYTLGASIGKKLQAVVESLNTEQYDQARELLEPLSQRKNKNPYERAVVYQMLGLVASASDKYEKALGYFEKSLSEDAVPGAAQASLRFSLNEAEHTRVVAELQARAASQL